MQPPKFQITGRHWIRQLLLASSTMMSPNEGGRFNLESKSVGVLKEPLRRTCWGYSSICSGTKGNCPSENCAPGGCQSNWHQNTKQSAWNQHWHLWYIFSYTSWNSCPVSVSVFRMTERRKWASHSGSNPRRQTSAREGYKSWSHGMTNVSILEANMLKNSSTLPVSVSIYISIKLGLVPANGPRETFFERSTYISRFDTLLYIARIYLLG